ncbi:MAG: replicative DNA helicase [Armatimonadetes bacterium]|nr:replicative DNA helicase [Armatimonadota bacterium]
MHSRTAEAVRERNQRLIDIPYICSISWVGLAPIQEFAVSANPPVDRVPPQNLEAEQSILGAMLLERDAIARVVELVRAEDFYRDAHRRIYEVISELFERGEPADLISVTDRLRVLGLLDDAGGAAYVTSLLHAVPTAANVEYYARLVVQKAMLRQMISAGTQIVGMGFREDQDVELLLDQAEKMVFGIASRRMGQHFLPISEVLRESFEQIDRRYRDKGTISGVPTGFAELDKITAGLQPSDLIIIAARPSMGKCLKFDAEVVDASTGEVRTIQEMVAAGQAALLTLGHDHRFRPAAPSLFVDDGVKPVFRVTTSGGRSVETTLTHPFLTPSGWEPLAALAPGALIAVPRRLPVYGRSDLPDHEVKLLAYLCSGRLPARPQIAEDFSDAAAAILAGARGRRVAQSGISGGSEGGAAVADLFWRYPEMGQAPHLRALPGAVFTLRREKLALFLNRLMGALAEVGEQPHGYQVQATFPSARMARGVQHLLLRFGVPAARRDGTLNLGIGATLALVREVGIFGWERLRRWARNAQRSLLDEIDVMWEEVVSIEEAGLFQVYDLTVPETHNFVANDVCVHNTTLALNIAQHAAVQHQVPVAIFSLETNKEQLVQRMLCSEAQVDSSRLRSGHLSDADWPRLATAMGKLSEAPIFIDDSSALSAIEMRAKARKLKAEHGLGLIIIDYIQMMQSYKRAENRTQEVSEIARAIKSLAKELNLPVIGISQLSRVVEATGSRLPQLSHLRECVTADTVVWDADTGCRLTVGELARQESWPRLLSLNSTMRLVPVQPAAVMEKGENEVFEVRTSTGRRLKATANHPVLTPEGWKPVGELCQGSTIAAARSLPLFGARPAELTLVGIEGRKAALVEQCGAELLHRRAKPQVDRLPLAALLARRLRAPGIYQMATGDVLWDRVASITPLGKAPVYDLVMPGTHNFIADGLVVHNSGELEQVADLVLFIYREEYYDEAKARADGKQHVAEIRVAKHRNGPVGNVEMFFHKEHGRFRDLDRKHAGTGGS